MYKTQCVSVSTFLAWNVKEEARIMRDKFAFSVSALEILDSAFILGGERDIDAGRSIAPKFYGRNCCL